MLSWLLRLVERRPRAVVVAAAPSLPVATWLSVMLPLDSDLPNLLPPDIPVVKSAHKLYAWSGRIGAMYIGIVRGPELTTLEALKRFTEVAATQAEVGGPLRPRG